MCEGQIASAQYKLDADHAERRKGCLFLKAWVVLLQGLNSFYASLSQLEGRVSSSDSSAFDGRTIRWDALPDVIWKNEE